MRILSIDPGEKHLGIALSDPTGTLANPLTVVQHTARLADAALIVQLGMQHEVGLFLVGQALDDDDRQTPQSRRAGRLAEAIRSQTNLPVLLWDESGSTQAARQASIALGVSSRKRRRQGHSHLDDVAATYILQTYLDAHIAK